MNSKKTTVLMTKETAGTLQKKTYKNSCSVFLTDNTE